MNTTADMDAAKRVVDAINLHRVADLGNAIGKWIACRLSDGSSDGVLYDSKSDAVRHQHHDETYFAFYQIVPGGITEREALTFLRIHRNLYDKGIRLADPDHSSGGRDLIKRASSEDMYNQIRSLFIGDRPPSNLIIPKG